MKTYYFRGSFRMWLGGEKSILRYKIISCAIVPNYFRFMYKSHYLSKYETSYL